jgi:hypothetical protein
MLTSGSARESFGGAELLKIKEGIGFGMGMEACLDRDELINVACMLAR